jgi:HEAT repeat protein
MTTITLAALLSVAVMPDARGAILPLPGYSGTGGTGWPKKTDPAFPSTAGLYGDEDAEPLTALSTEGEDLRDAVAEPPSIPLLQAGLRSPATLDRLAAVHSAALAHDVKAVPFLRGVLLRLDEPTRLRAAAALALGRIGDELGVSALSEALKDPMPAVRYAAALALGRIPADGVATRLERVLRTDPDWQPRYAATISLGRTRRPFVATVLAEALREDASWQVRQQAARSLQDIGTPHAAALLVGALRDLEPTVRAAAGTALGEIGSPEQLRRLSEALKIETDPAVRSVFASALRRGLSRG